MSTLLIVGSSVVGAGVGFVAGAWYGFATDTSDMPIMAAFTAPVGACAGAIVGAAVGAHFFA